jgi:hypothetical protein
LRSSPGVRLRRDIRNWRNAFPLTLTLSLRERECPVRFSPSSCGRGNVRCGFSLFLRERECPVWFLPLPAGEGRGEGIRRHRCPTTLRHSPLQPLRIRHQLIQHYPPSFVETHLLMLLADFSGRMAGNGGVTGLPLRIMPCESRWLHLCQHTCRSFP